MPPVRRRTRWEQWWADGATAVEASRAQGPAPQLSVRALVPALEVSVAGERVRLREMPAKLLLGLLVAHPEPLHVERAVDLLWPDAPPGVGRDRLNTVAHRLRTALAATGAGGRPVRRTGDLLVLDPSGWEVDLFALRRAVGDGDDDARRWAVEAAPAACATPSSPTTTC